MQLRDYQQEVVDMIDKLEPRKLSHTDGNRFR